MSDPDPRIQTFWEVAKRRAKLARLPGYFGPSALESLMPPVWSFGDESSLDELIGQGEQVATVPRAEYDDADESLPEVGTLGIVVDAGGAPRALVVTSAVSTEPEFVAETLTVLYSE